MIFSAEFSMDSIFVCLFVSFFLSFFLPFVVIFFFLQSLSFRIVFILFWPPLFRRRSIPFDAGNLFESLEEPNKSRKIFTFLHRCIFPVFQILTEYSFDAFLSWTWWINNRIWYYQKQTVFFPWKCLHLNFFFFCQMKIWFKSSFGVFS